MHTFRATLIAAAMACAAASAPAAGAAPAPAAEGFTFVRSLEGIHEYKLDANGLSVLVVPRHAAPVVTFQVTYRVGSRNEVTGTTGGTHLLEHLMFKGSKAYPESSKDSIDRYLERTGASFNATTSYDRTNYFATLGKDKLEGYVAIEADRMRNLLLEPKGLADEMTVVRNEYELAENDPAQALDREVRATAYQAHPYHHPVIGWRSDIERVGVDQLRAFYNTYYWPNNATVTVVGDIEPAKALALVRTYYAAIPAAPAPMPKVTTEEPPQQGARRVTLSRTGETPVVSIAFKAPSGLDADIAPLRMLGMILADGQNSRLSRALLETSQAVTASAYVDQQHDNGLFFVGATLPPGGRPEAVEKALWAQIDRVKRSGVSADEIAQAMGPYRAQRAYERDGTAGVASALNEAIATGDWTSYVTFPEQMAKVTPADVQRVAQKYLVADQSTTGVFLPKRASK